MINLALDGCCTMDQEGSHFFILSCLVMRFQSLPSAINYESGDIDTLATSLAFIHHDGSLSLISLSSIIALSLFSRNGSDKPFEIRFVKSNWVTYSLKNSKKVKVKG